MQSAHDAEVLCLAYSPMMIPTAAGGSSTTTLPPRSYPDCGNVTSEKKTPPSAEGGSGTGVSVAAMSSSSSSPFFASQNSAVSAGAATRANALCGSAPRIVSSWEAVDPLDPAAAADKMLSLSLMSSSVPSVSESKTGGSGGAGEPDQGGSGCVSTGADERLGKRDTDVEHGNHEADSIGVRPNAELTGERQHQRDCLPLVLLASASRDRLVHVFDASAPSRSGGAATTTATAAAFSPGESDDIGSSAGRSREAGGRAGREEIEMAKSSGAETENSGGTKKANSGAAAETAGVQAAVAAGFPLLKSLDSHSGSVTAAKFSKDGKRYLYIRYFYFPYWTKRVVFTIFSNKNNHAREFRRCGEPIGACSIACHVIFPKRGTYSRTHYEALGKAGDEWARAGGAGYCRLYSAVVGVVVAGAAGAAAGPAGAAAGALFVVIAAR